MLGTEYVGAVEFRVFAGTTSLTKILHHLATVLGICRRAHQVQCLGAFRKNKLQTKRTQTAASALHFLHDYLGWNGSARPVAIGMFGRLHPEFPACRDKALRRCGKFGERYLRKRNSALAKSTREKEVHAAVVASVETFTATAPGKFVKKLSAACRSASLGAREKTSQ